MSQSVTMCQMHMFCPILAVMFMTWTLMYLIGNTQRLKKKVSWFLPLLLSEVYCNVTRQLHHTLVYTHSMHCTTPWLSSSMQLYRRKQLFVCCLILLTSADLRATSPVPGHIATEAYNHATCSQGNKWERKKTLNGLLVRTFWDLDNRWDVLWAVFCNPCNVFFRHVS